MMVGPMVTIIATALHPPTSVAYMLRRVVLQRRKSKLKTCAAITNDHSAVPTFAAFFNPP